jgi:hypothetical protein
MEKVLTTDCIVTTDKDGLVLTSTQMVLHVTTVNGLMHIWFDASGDNHMWDKNSKEFKIRGMTCDGGFFEEHSSRYATFDEFLEQVKRGWELEYLHGYQSYEARLPLMKEFAELRGGVFLSDYNEMVARHERNRLEEEARTVRAKAAKEKLQVDFPVGANITIDSRRYHVQEHLWNGIKCLNLGKYDIVGTKEFFFGWFQVLADQLGIGTAEASALLNGVAPTPTPSAEG